MTSFCQISRDENKTIGLERILKTNDKWFLGLRVPREFLQTLRNKKMQKWNLTSEMVTLSLLVYTLVDGRRVKLGGEEVRNIHCYTKLKKAGIPILKMGFSLCSRFLRKNNEFCDKNILNYLRQIHQWCRVKKKITLEWSKIFWTCSKTIVLVNNNLLKNFRNYRIKSTLLQTIRGKAEGL